MAQSDGSSGLLDAFLCLLLQPLLLQIGLSFPGLHWHFLQGSRNALVFHDFASQVSLAPTKDFHFDHVSLVTDFELMQPPLCQNFQSSWLLSCPRMNLVPSDVLRGFLNVVYLVDYHACVQLACGYGLKLDWHVYLLWLHVLSHVQTDCYSLKDVIALEIGFCKEISVCSLIFLESLIYAFCHLTLHQSSL